MLPLGMPPILGPGMETAYSPPPGTALDLTTAVAPLTRRIQRLRTAPDRVFRGVAIGAGAVTLILIGAIALFLLLKAWPAFRVAGFSFLTTSQWNPDAAHPVFGIAAMLYGTAVIAVIALVLALPVAVATALFVNEYAPRRLVRPMTSLIDLLAAVPSLVFGMWGFFFLQPHIIGVSRFLNAHFGFVPIFHADRALFGSSLFEAGIVVGLMIVPIITAVTRETLARVPRSLVEAAYSLGSTRAGAIRHVLLPYGRSGIVGGAMLGLGRALGETIAVTLVLSISFQISGHILAPGGGSVAALIALKFGEATPFEREALVAAGFVLFLVTLGVNMAARLVVNRFSRVAADLT